MFFCKEEDSGYVIAEVQGGQCSPRTPSSRPTMTVSHEDNDDNDESLASCCVGLINFLSLCLALLLILPAAVHEPVMTDDCARTMTILAYTAGGCLVASIVTTQAVIHGRAAVARCCGVPTILFCICGAVCSVWLWVALLPVVESNGYLSCSVPTGFIAPVGLVAWIGFLVTCITVTMFIRVVCCGNPKSPRRDETAAPTVLIVQIVN